MEEDIADSEAQRCEQQGPSRKNANQPTEAVPVEVIPESPASCHDVWTYVTHIKEVFEDEHLSGEAVLAVSATPRASLAARL